MARLAIFDAFEPIQLKMLLIASSCVKDGLDDELNDLNEFNDKSVKVELWVSCFIVGKKNYIFYSSICRQECLSQLYS
jgi:hypothetical protein